MIFNMAGGSPVKAEVVVEGFNDHGTLEPLSVLMGELCAVPLGNGDVLIAGYGPTIATVEGYTANGEKKQFADLSVGRYRLAGAMRGDGCALLGGGQGPSGYTSAVDCYTPDGTRIALPNLYSSRYQLEAATLGDGRVLFAGGYNGSYLGAVECYALDGTRTYPFGGGMSVGRDSFTGETLGDGRVLFGGGLSSGSNEKAEVDCFAPDGTRTAFPALSVARMDLVSAALGDGRVVFYAGLRTPNVECYSPDGTKVMFESAPSTPYYLRNPAGATLSDGRVVFAGGYAGNNTVTDEVVAYGSDGIRQTMPNLSAPRHTMAGATLGDGRTIFGGGMPLGGGNSNVVDYYSSGKKNIKIPAGNAYRFQEHSGEQPATSQDRQIAINAPNRGYFRMVPMDIEI